MGANIAAVETAASFCINADRAVNYYSDSKGTRLNYEAVKCAVTNIRSKAQLDDCWKVEIEKDYKQRRKRENK